MAKDRIAWLPGEGVDAALFGAITSKPAKAAATELAPALPRNLINAGRLIPDTRNRSLEEAAGRAASVSQLSVTSLAKTTI